MKRIALIAAFVLAISTDAARADTNVVVLNIKGAIGVTSTGYKSAIRLIESGRVPVERMHTHNFDLADAELAIRTLAREIPDDESIHSCLIPAH